MEGWETTIRMNSMREKEKEKNVSPIRGSVSSSEWPHTQKNIYMDSTN